MRHRWLLLGVAAYLACGTLLALPGCGMYAPPAEPISPVTPEPPPSPPTDQGVPTGVAGILTGMNFGQVVAVLGPDYIDVPEVPGDPNAYRWGQRYVMFVDGAVVRAITAEVEDVK